MKETIDQQVSGQTGESGSSMTTNNIRKYKKAEKTLRFEDLLNFVMDFWPKKIATSVKLTCDFEAFTGVIPTLRDIDSSHEELFKDLSLYNLLLHLDYAILIATHRAGLVQNVVRTRELDSSYIRYLFETKSIFYAVEADLSKIPKGLVDNLNTIYDRDLIIKYIKANT
jgi:hypothetical protein